MYFTALTSTFFNRGNRADFNVMLCFVVCTVEYSLYDREWELWKFGELWVVEM